MLTGHTNRVNAVAFSPDGRLLASGSSDGTWRIWDPATGAELREHRDGQGAVLAVAFSPDGRWLATGSWDANVRVWEACYGCLDHEALLDLAHTRITRELTEAERELYVP